MKQRLLFQFGAFTLNPGAMSLWRGEELIHLPPKAFDTLAVLVQQRGEVVTKQQLLDTVWPGTYVEESNLAQNVFLLRKKLGQTSEGGEYIETLSKRGYRMSVPVREIEIAEDDKTHPEVDAPVAVTIAAPARTYRRLVAAAPVVAALMCVVVAVSYLRRGSGTAPAAPDFIQITHDTKDKRGRTGTLGGPDAALLTSGDRLYFTSGTSTGPSVWQVAAKGGEPVQIPVPFAYPQLLDFSIARSELLVAGSIDNVTSRPLWSVPVPAGNPRRLGSFTARDAAWSPDGREIAFTDGAQLNLSNDRGTDVRKLADLPGIGWRPRWSPDGKILRLTVAEVAGGTEYLWEVSRAGGHAHRLLEGWNTPPFECCGVWSPDGKQFLFQATRGGKTDIWSLADANSSLPIQVSHGQLNSLAPAFSPDGKKLFVIGQQLRGELQRLDSKSGHFVPFLNGISADFVEFSRDGAWLLYVAYPEGTLWRCRPDGREPLQLTFAPIEVMMPHWSPDGKRILFHGPGGGHDEVYIVSAQGGEPLPIARNSGRRMMGPTWAPDGNSIMYSDYPFFGADPSKIAIHILDLRTKLITDVPASQGDFAPVWSPDGRYTAASTVRGSRILIFDFQTKQWSDVAEGWDLKKWSRDGEYLFFMRHGDDPAIMRLRVGDRKAKEVASLRNFDQTGRLAGLEFSLDLSDSPMLLKDTGTQEIYSMDWREQ